MTALHLQGVRHVVEAFENYSGLIEKNMVQLTVVGTRQKIYVH